jgi:hypothetical protein
MTDPEFEAFMRGSVKPYYWAFLTVPGGATLRIQTDSKNTWAELKLARADLNKITLTVGLKGHLSSVFNRLSRDVDARVPLGLFAELAV